VVVQTSGFIRRPRAAAFLDNYESYWRDCHAADDTVTPEILDGYVRALVTRELYGPGASADVLPGRTYAQGGLADTPAAADEPVSGDADSNN
jgi:hypothetical protein